MLAPTTDLFLLLSEPADLPHELDITSTHVLTTEAHPMRIERPAASPLAPPADASDRLDDEAAGAQEAPDGSCASEKAEEADARAGGRRPMPPWWGSSDGLLDEEWPEEPRS